MARKSLSDQILEEVDRARGLLKPVQDIVDPMTAHMVGTALESLRLVETMCIKAKQRGVDDILGRNLVNVPVLQAPAAAKQPQPRTKRPAPARVKGEGK